MPSVKLKQFLDEASKEYHEALRVDGNPGTRYLVDRGLSGVTAQRFRLGYVASPVVGHEEYAGRLCIPYLSALGEVVGAKFRRLDLDTDNPETGAKYLGLHGADGAPRIYNPSALVLPGKSICVCEGELDAVAATQEGLNAIGLPGVTSFDPEKMTPPLRGYDTVFILADNDDKGQGRKFAEMVAKHVRNSRIVPMPEGHDVNSYTKAFPGELRKRLEI